MEAPKALLNSLGRGQQSNREDNPEPDMTGSTFKHLPAGDQELRVDQKDTIRTGHTKMRKSRKMRKDAQIPEKMRIDV